MPWAAFDSTLGVCVCFTVHTHGRCISAAIIAGVIAVVAAAAVVLVVVVAGEVGLAEAVVVVVVVVVGVVYSSNSISNSNINSINPHSGGGNIRRSPSCEGCHSIIVW